MNIPKDYIKEISDIDYNKLLLTKVNDNLYLSQTDIELLNLYKIPYNDCQSLSEIIMMIEMLDDYDEDLELLVSKLSEQKYYYQVNK